MNQKMPIRIWNSSKERKAEISEMVEKARVLWDSEEFQVKLKEDLRIVKEVCEKMRKDSIVTWDMMLQPYGI